MTWKNTIRLGVIMGALGPIAGFWLYYFLEYRNFNHIQFIKLITGMHLSSALLSLSLLTNLASFFLFINLKHDNSARGVLMATIFYAIIGFILKFAF